jgi:hypothetical protein
MVGIIAWTRKREQLWNKGNFNFGALIIIKPSCMYYVYLFIFTMYFFFFLLPQCIADLLVLIILIVDISIIHVKIVICNCSQVQCMPSYGVCVTSYLRYWGGLKWVAQLIKLIQLRVKDLEVYGSNSDKEKKLTY